METQKYVFIVVLHIALAVPECLGDIAAVDGNLRLCIARLPINSILKSGGVLIEQCKSKFFDVSAGAVLGSRPAHLRCGLTVSFGASLNTPAFFSSSRHCSHSAAGLLFIL